MALLEQHMEKHCDAQDGLQVEADTGESLKIIDVLVDNATADFVELYIDTVFVGQLSVGHDLGNHCGFGYDSEPVQSLLSYLMLKEIFKGFPIAEGQKFEVKTDDASNMDCTIVYEKYDDGDMTEEMENGSKAIEYLMINYMDTGGVSIAGDNHYDNSLIPAEAIQFPIGEAVPARKEIDIIGILASDEGSSTAGAGEFAITQYLKLIKDRETLFDEDKNGLRLRGHYVDSGNDDYHGMGYGMIGYFTDVNTKKPLLFKEPLKFVAGVELNIYVNVALNVDSLTQDVMTIALIQKIHRLT